MSNFLSLSFSGGRNDANGEWDMFYSNISSTEKFHRRTGTTCRQIFQLFVSDVHRCSLRMHVFVLLSSFFPIHISKEENNHKQQNNNEARKGRNQGKNEYWSTKTQDLERERNSHRRQKEDTRRITICSGVNWNIMCVCMREWMGEGAFNVRNMYNVKSLSAVYWNERKKK